MLTFLLWTVSALPKAYSMTAVNGLLVRGIYNLSVGDYVNLTFNLSQGFIIVSQPNFYYVNIARDCTPSGCTWWHKTLSASWSNGIYALGNSTGTAQVTSLREGTFLITIAYITDCHLGVATDHAALFTWVIDPGSSTCLFNTITSGTITINSLDITAGQYACLYGTHFRWGFLTVDNATRGTSAVDQIGAGMLTNKQINETFELRMNITWDDSRHEDYNYGSIDIERYPTGPSVIYKGSAYAFAAGGCNGTECAIGPSGSNSGNINGIPSKSDGDPIPEDGGGGGGGGGGSGGVNVGLILVIVGGVLTLAIVGVIAIGVIKNRRPPLGEYETLATLSEPPASTE
jgi:hypothetical protein